MFLIVDFIYVCATIYQLISFQVPLHLRCKTWSIPLHAPYETKKLIPVSFHAAIRIAAIVGGMSVEKQVRVLKARPHVVVGTPGRLWELMKTVCSPGMLH